MFPLTYIRTINTEFIMRYKKHPTQDELKSIFRYSDGHLIWRTDRYSNKVKGCPAGSKDFKGYIVVNLNRSGYKAHRLIWIYYYGDIEKGIQIDHINGIKDDNRIDNLRLATNGQNQWNIKSVRGCYFNKRNQKWTSQISASGRKYHVGDFETRDMAHRAYLKAKRKFHKTT